MACQQSVANSNRSMGIVKQRLSARDILGVDWVMLRKSTSVQYLCVLNCTSSVWQVRPEAAGLWRPVEAHLEEEGEDHEEAGAQDGVLRLQVEEPGSHQEDQALRARWREEEEGPDDPVLVWILLNKWPLSE